MFSDYLLNWFISILILVITIVTYLYVNRNLNYWTKRGIIGPKPFPILGNLYTLLFKTQFDVELEWYRKYGKIYGLFRGNTPELIVAEPELVKQILVKDFNAFRNRRLEASSKSKLGKHLVYARDNEWKSLRAITTPAFSSGKLKKMYSLINDCCDEFMVSLDDYAKDGKEIELKRHHGAYALDVIARCAFATNTNTYKNPDNEFAKQMNANIDIKAWKVILYFVLPTSMGKYTRKLLNIGNDAIIFFGKVGQHLMKQRKASNQIHNDFLQILINVERNDDLIIETDDIAKNHLNEGNDEIIANTKALSKVSEKKLTEDQILSMCYVFFIAGYETTSTTLSLCTYELALNVEIQQKLYEESKNAINQNGRIEFDRLLTLPYLDAVLSETLRKYPPVVKLNRQAMNDIVLGDTGIKIAKGMTVEIPVLAIHYDPENYPIPEKFIPERFLPENRNKIKPYTYMPFGIGPRNCIGMRFALLEAKLALINMILKFQFFTTSNTSIPIRWDKNIRVNRTEKIFVGIKRR